MDCGTVRDLMSIMSGIETLTTLGNGARVLPGRISPRNDPISDLYIVTWFSGQAYSANFNIQIGAINSDLFTMTAGELALIPCSINSHLIVITCHFLASLSRKSFTDHKLTL